MGSDKSEDPSDSSQSQNSPLWSFRLTFLERVEALGWHGADWQSLNWANPDGCCILVEGHGGMLRSSPHSVQS